MSKNKAAVALGKKRWKGKTKAERREHMRMMAQRSVAARLLKKSEKTS